MQSCAPGILRKIVAASSKLVKSRSPKNRSTGALIVANSGFEMPQRGFDHIADRKSTRLNSSHLGISYAVFCLKKHTAPPPGTTTHPAAVGVSGGPLCYLRV